MIIPVRCFTCGKVVGNKCQSRDIPFLPAHSSLAATAVFADFRADPFSPLTGEQYINLLSADYSEMDALNALGLRRYCCRRMLLSHVDLIEKLLNYNSRARNSQGAAPLPPHPSPPPLIPSAGVSVCALPFRRHGEKDHYVSWAGANLLRMSPLLCIHCTVAILTYPFSSCGSSPSLSLMTTLPSSSS